MADPPPVARARLAAQLLAGPPAPDPPAVAERLLAIQAQDPRGARLAIRARTSGTNAVEVDRALTHERTLLITWLNRGTLHLVRSEDYPWLQALTAPRLLAVNARRLAQEGIEPGAADRAVGVIERALAGEGPLTRDQLGERLARARVRTEGQALVHLLFLACLRGLAVRGPMIDGRHAYALVRDWLGEPGPVDGEAALRELARRYLAGHGPAADRDLAKWAGLPLRDARAGLSAMASELEQLEGGLVDLRGRGPVPADLPPPRLLGSYEPVLMGWTSREPVLASHEAEVVSGGVFRPFALVEGRAAATWSLRDPEVSLAPFRRLGRAEDAALRADAADVKRFLGGA